MSQFLSPASQPLGDILPDRPVSSTISNFSPPALSQEFSLQQHLPQSSIHIFSCQWASCKAAFSSIAELVGHVTVDHILKLVDEPAPQPLCSAVHNRQFDFNALSCHWGNCAMYPYPESIPSSSMTTFPDTILNVLTTHLMQDHLGVHYPFPQSTTMHTEPSAKAPPTCTGNITPSPLQSLPDSCNESSTDTPSDPSPRDRSQSHSPNPLSTHYSAKSCKWIGCTEFFSSPDDLTTHILSAHIGSGKAHYDCYWEGCTRHGTQGFASKQKVARHMQSHTGHRPFQCKTCGQYFSETATLQQHMRRHTQESVYFSCFSRFMGILLRYSRAIRL